MKGLTSLVPLAQDQLHVGLLSQVRPSLDEADEEGSMTAAPQTAKSSADISALLSFMLSLLLPTAIAVPITTTFINYYFQLFHSVPFFLQLLPQSARQIR